MRMKDKALTDDDIIKMFMQGWSKESLIKKVKSANEVTLPAAKGLVERTIYRYQMEEIKRSARDLGKNSSQTKQINDVVIIPQ